MGSDEQVRKDKSNDLDYSNQNLHLLDYGMENFYWNSYGGGSCGR